MKITMYCLFISLALSYAYGQISNAIYGTRSVLVIQSMSDKGEADPWLTIENNDISFPKHGFNPTTTHVFTAYKPMYRYNGTQWEIIFVKERH